MTRAIRLVALAAVLVAAAALAAPTPQPSIQLPPELARVLTDYETAWRARDAAALARLFAEDGFVMSSNQLPVRGRAAIEKQYTGSGGPLFLRAFAYATEGRLGYILGGFTNRQGARRHREVHAHAVQGRRRPLAHLLGHGQREPAVRIV